MILTSPNSLKLNLIWFIVTYIGRSQKRSKTTQMSFERRVRVGHGLRYEVDFHVEYWLGLKH